MQQVIHIDSSFQSNREIAATIGFFDGVHLGHRFLIDQLKNLAEAKGLPSAIITFPQHPKITLQTGYIPKLLNTLSERMLRLSLTDIDYCYLLDFSKELSQLDARTFIQEKLSKQFHVKYLLIGYDHRFGKDRTEDFEDYVKYGRECDMEIVRALEFPVSHISSTVIRNKLMNGNLEEANRILSYNYTLRGKVVAGNQLGREIGFPTANLEVDPDKIIPAAGVYAVRIITDLVEYTGMAYIGNRPTVTNHGEKRIEAHLFNFSGDLYGKILRLELVAFIREEKHFSGIEELKKQLAEDKKKAYSSLIHIAAPHRKILLL
jgi:riboflavin kinase/FMN adenylyltransferase